MEQQKRKWGQQRIVDAGGPVRPGEQPHPRPSLHSTLNLYKTALGLVLMFIAVFIVLAVFIGNYDLVIHQSGMVLQVIFKHFIWPLIGVIALIAGFRLVRREIMKHQRDMRSLRRMDAQIADIEAGARKQDAEAEEIRSAAQVKSAHAWQLANTLPFDEHGNLAHFDHLSRQVRQYTGRAPEFPLLTSYHNAPRVTSAAGGTTVTEEKPGRQLMLPAPKTIPPMYDLVDAYRSLDIGDRILLGLSDRSEYLTVDDDKLCHGVFNAITGRGKSVVERGIASKLLKASHLVTWLDLKFALMTESGLDYRPLAKKLWSQPPMRILINGQVYEVPHVVRNEGDIAAVLHWLAYDELERRLHMRDAGDFSYPSHYVFLEEMLAFIKIYPEAAEDVIRIIALGRELRIKLFTAAQNFLAKDTKLTGGAKENFETAYFLGGDTYSGAKVLDVTQKDLNEYLTRYQIELGQGLTLLRNNTAAPKATLVRVGMASNEAIYYHHGRADDFRLPPRTEVYTPLARIVPTVEGTLSALPGQGDLKRLYGGYSAVPTTRSDRREMPFPEQCARDTGPLPRNGFNGLVEQSAQYAETTVPTMPEEHADSSSEDLVMTNHQIRAFVHNYVMRGLNAEESVTSIPSNKRPGKGLSYRRYRKHTSTLIRQHKLQRGSGIFPETLRNMPEER